VEDFLRWSPHVKNTRDKAVSALSREQLTELQRLLTSFADTAGMDLAEMPDKAAEAEQRAAAAEQAAREAADRAASVERRVGEAEERADTRVKAAEARARAAETRPKPPPTPRRVTRPPEHYDDLAQEEVIALLGSLEEPDLETLVEYERDHANRPRVIDAIESVLARR